MHACRIERNVTNLCKHWQAPGCVYVKPTRSLHPCGARQTPLRVVSSTRATCLKYSMHRPERADIRATTCHLSLGVHARCARPAHMERAQDIHSSASCTTSGYSRQKGKASFPSSPQQQAAVSPHHRCSRAQLVRMEPQSHQLARQP